MDKDFSAGGKESSSENNNNVSLNTDPNSKSLLDEDKKENEAISKGGFNKDCLHRHGVRVTVSHSTIEQVGGGGKGGDSKTKSGAGQPRSKSFLEQVPVGKGPPLMRVSFNGKKGTHGSHGDGFTNIAHGIGLLINESGEKGEDQQKKQHILQTNSGLNPAPVSQRVFDSSLSFADLVRTCGQKRKPARLESVQLNNSLLSTPQSSTLVSNYFNKYRSYLDHLRTTHGYSKHEFGTVGVVPPITNLSIPLPCMPTAIALDKVQDPDLAQILEKTTTDSIRSLWYQIEGGDSESIVIQCDEEDKGALPERNARYQTQSYSSDSNVPSGAEYHNSKVNDNTDGTVKKKESLANLNSKDCVETEQGTSFRTSSDFETFSSSRLDTTVSQAVVAEPTMKNTLTSLLSSQHNGTAEWGDNEAKTQTVGYSLRTRNNVSSMDSMAQHQQRMAQAKQQQQQHQQQGLSQNDGMQQESLVQSHLAQNGANSLGKLQPGGHSRHKICSRFQGVTMPSDTSTSSSATLASSQARAPFSQDTMTLSAEQGSRVENSNPATGTQGSTQNAGSMYTLDSLVSTDSSIPSMSSSMTNSRTLKASYACLDPNGAMPMGIKDGFNGNAFGDINELTLPNNIQQIPESGRESRWTDFHGRHDVLGGDKNTFGQSSDPPTNSHDRSRLALAFTEPEPPQHWSFNLKGSQRPINKIGKDCGLETANQKERNSASMSTLGGGAVNEQQSMNPKPWVSFSTSNPVSSRLDPPREVSDGLLTSNTNDLSRLHQWRLNMPAFESLKLQGQGRESLPLTSNAFSEATLGQRLDSFQPSLDPLAAVGNGFSTKSSWSTCGGDIVSPSKSSSRYLQRVHTSTPGLQQLLDNGHAQHSYQVSRPNDPRHKLFNNNNAACLVASDKNRQQYDSAPFNACEPWSSATCDDMSEYFDASLQLSKSGIPSSQSNTSVMVMDSHGGKGLPSMNIIQGHSSHNILNDYNTSAFGCDNPYKSSPLDRQSSAFGNQKDILSLPSASSYSNITSTTLPQEQHVKQNDTKQHSDDIFLTYDNASLSDLDMTSCDTISPPWYELAPLPEDAEDIRSDNTQDQNKLGHLNFLGNSTEREAQPRPNATSEIGYSLQQGSYISVNASTQSSYGNNSKLESKPRLILGSNTVSQRSNEVDKESCIIDADKNRVGGAFVQDGEKVQHRKQFPFSCHPKHGCASTPHLNGGQFQQPQFQKATVNQQQQNSVPQQMYCIPNILMPPPPPQGQARHPGVLSYHQGMLGNVAASSHFPQGLMRVPLVDMSRLVYLQSLPFNMASATHTPNSNHNNSSSSNPHVNTSNIITINTADLDFSGGTGDKSGLRAAKTIGIRGKNTLLRLRSSTIGDNTFPGLRTTDDTLLAKGNKARKSNGNPWDADLEHDFSSSLFSKVTAMQDQSCMHPEFGLIYPEGQTGSNNPANPEANFRSSTSMQQWPSVPDMHPEMLDMLPVRKQPVEDYSGRQMCWGDMELMMSSKEQLQVMRKSNKPLGSNKANLISILPKSTPGEGMDIRGNDCVFERADI